MSHSNHGKCLTLGTPATYRISVQGYLDNIWSDRLWGMQIAKSSGADQVPVTILVGRLRDQAALLGVLNSLYEMHRPILLVEYQDGSRKVK